MNTSFKENRVTAPFAKLIETIRLVTSKMVGNDDDNNTPTLDNYANRPEGITPEEQAENVRIAAELKRDTDARNARITQPSSKFTNFAKKVQDKANTGNVPQYPTKGTNTSKKIEVDDISQEK